MIELFKFTEEGGATYTYTSNLFPVNFNLETYTPIVIESKELTKTDNLQKSAMQIILEDTNELGKSLLGVLTEKVLKVEIYRDYLIFYRGKITEIRQSKRTIYFKCESNFINFGRIGQPETYSIHCRHRLYSIGCTVSRTDFETTYPVYNLNSQTPLIPSITQSTGYFTNGIARLNSMERTIIHQDAQTLFLDMPFIGNTSGTLYLYPGCDLSMDTCGNKFNNYPNYGGDRWLPGRNPFGGRGIF